MFWAHALFALLLLVTCNGLQQTVESMWQKLDKLLYYPTKDVQHVCLFLRSDNRYHEDAENVYTRWFLQNQNLPHTVNSYSVDKLNRSFLDIESLPSVMIITNMSEIQLVVNHFVHYSRIFFFIITDGIDPNKVRRILHRIWIDHMIFNMYILVNGIVIIYDPFDYDAKTKQYGKIREYTGENQLERTLFRDMRGYPLRVQIFYSVYARPHVNKTTKEIYKLQGVDGKVALLLEERMNFTMQLQKPNPAYFGERNANGTYNGAIGSIINREIDFCFTGFFVKDYMVPEMDFTVAVYDDKLCIYVPKAKRIPQSILPIFSVNSNIWLGFIVSAFICAVIWSGMRCLNVWLGISSLKDVPRPLENIRFQFIRILIDTWVVWVRVNILRYPPFNSERMFLASLCLVSVIFGAIFESSLATVYIHPMYYKDINTLRDLDKSGLKVIYKYSSMADDLFFSETSTLFASLNKKLTYLKNLHANVILDVAENGGKAGVTRMNSLILQSMRFIISKQIWMVPECPKYYTISYVMPKYSPWEETVNRYLLQFLNAGLIKKWITEMETETDIKIMMQQQLKFTEVFKVLTVIDLQLAFYVVLLGSCGAMLSFSIELYIIKWTRRT